MLNWGPPTGDAAAMRSAITKRWRDRLGGWVSEWSLLAERDAATEQHDEPGPASHRPDHPDAVDRVHDSVEPDRAVTTRRSRPERDR
jgi:hypothetical protein